MKESKDLIYKDEFYRIVGAAMEVSNTLGLIINFGSKRLEWKRYANTK